MLGWVRDREWGLIPSDLFSFSVIILAVYRSICLRGGYASPPLYTVFCPVFGQARCPSGASTLPNKGKHVAPSGHISFSSRAQYPTFSSHQYLPISFPFPGNAFSPICHPFPFPVPPIIPHPLPSSPAVIKLYEILQTASGQLPDTFPSNTPGPASRQWVDNPKSLSMLISKCFDHYFQFMLRFYIQG